MKNLILLFTLFISINGFTQTEEAEVTFFAQAMFDIEDDNAIVALESEMRNNPNIKIVRLDIFAKRVFLLTKDMELLSEDEFLSWFNEYSDKVRCIQIGRQGLDVIQPYPFEGCQN